MQLLMVLSLSLLPQLASAGDDEDRGSARERIEPEGFLYGIGVSIDREIYKDFDRRVILLPVIGYSDEKWTVFGPFVRYELLQSGPIEYTIQAKPRFQGFDEDDSDIFEGMDERKFSMDLGFGAEYERDDWQIDLSYLHDVLDRSNGTEVSIGVGKLFRYKQLFIEPGVSLSYLDRKHVDYYYGVKASEATGFRPEYDGGDAVNAGLGIKFLTPAWFGGLTQFGIEHSWFDSVIADSPLTDEDRSLGMFVAYSRFF